MSASGPPMTATGSPTNAIVSPGNATGRPVTRTGLDVWNLPGRALLLVPLFTGLVDLLLRHTTP